MSGIAFINHEGRLQLDTALLPGTIAFDRTLQEEILRAVHSKFSARQEPIQQILGEINEFVTAYVCERAFPGFRRMDAVMAAIGNVYQLKAIVMSVDGDDITFSYEHEQPVKFKSDVFIRALAGIDDTAIADFCLTVSRAIEWDDPVVGKVRPTFTEIRGTFGAALSEYARQQAEDQGGQ